MDVWVPRYQSPCRPYGLIPPSPPAERRERLRRMCKQIVDREVRTHTGRILCPGMKGYSETIQAIGVSAFYPGQAAVRREVTKPAGGGPSITAPTAFYRMEDLTDTSGNGHDMTQNNGGSPVTFGAGKVGNCGQDFSQSSTVLSSFLTYPSNSAFSPGTGNFSLWGWAYADFLGSGRVFPIASKYGNAGDRQWIFGYQNQAFTGGENWMLNVSSDGTAQSRVLGSTASTGQWYFVAAWYDGANLNISANDGTVTQAAYASGVYTGSTVAVRIGGLLDTWRGKLDAICWINGHSWTTAEVTAGYNLGSGVEYYSGAWHG